MLTKADLVDVTDQWEPQTREGYPIIRIEAFPASRSGDCLLVVMDDGDAVLCKANGEFHPGRETCYDLTPRNAPPPQAAPEVPPVTVYAGLTQREQFASEALKPLIADDCGAHFFEPDKAARKAVEYADALIAALNKPASGPLGEPSVEDDVHPEVQAGGDRPTAGH